MKFNIDKKSAVSIGGVIAVGIVLATVKAPILRLMRGVR